MGSAWKTRHVGSDLGQQYLGRTTAYAWNSIQSFDLFVNWRSRSANSTLGRASDGLIQEIDVRQLLSYQEALVSSEAPREHPV